jgi:branched-chain amino acid aminotransferase
MSVPVWIDGELLDPEEARVAYDDHGVTVGDGVFETLKVVDGVPFALRRHLERLVRSAAALQLPPLDLPRLRQGIDAVCARADHGFLRVTVTAGRGPLGSPRDSMNPTMIVAVRPGEVRTDPAAVITVAHPRNETGVLAGVKSTSYAENVVALVWATAAGAEEALFPNTAGNLCEGTGSNVFVAVGGRLLTPPLASGCLAGVTRALLLEELAAVGIPALEEDLPMSALEQASEMFLTSTGREVQPVRTLDGRPLPAAPGPLTTRAQEVWRAAFGPGSTRLDP